MSSLLVMYTANNFDQIHGSSVISWLTAPTYARVVPNSAQPLHPAPIDLLSQAVTSQFDSDNGNDGFALPTESAGSLLPSEGRGFIP